MAASYCRVADLSQWKDAVIRLLRETIEHSPDWEFRRLEGLTQAARFSWAENARQSAVVYHKVLEAK